MTSMRRILWCAAACAFVVLIARGQDEKVDFDKCPQKVKDAVMARFPGTYLKAYVAMRDPSGQALPVDVVATGEDQAAAQHRLTEAVAYLAELVTAKGKRIDYGEGSGD